MKKTTQKGFTLVELVIVIAIIAILAAVLIPTFSGVVEKANQSKALQEARNANTNYIASLNLADLDWDTLDYYVQAGNYYFTVTNGQLNTTATKGTIDADENYDLLNASTGEYTEYVAPVTPEP